MTFAYPDGIDIFRLVLGKNMQYSGAIRVAPEQILEDTRDRKIDLLIDKLHLSADHSVLESG